MAARLCRPSACFVAAGLRRQRPGEIMLPRGIWYIRQGNLLGLRKAMRSLYIGACVLAGIFTLLPGRFLGSLLWKQTPGIMA